MLGYSRKIGRSGVFAGLVITSSLEDWRTSWFLPEWLALRDGLHLCLSKNHLDVEVELDAKIIEYALTTTQQSDQPLYPLMDDCRFLATRFNHIQFKHCYCKANKCANGLARKGVTQIDDFFVYDKPPVELKNSFIDDLNGKYSIRHYTATASLLDSWFNEIPFSTPQKKKKTKVRHRESY